jgi:hypothetical protein
VVAHLVGARRWDQGDQALQQFERLEDDVGGAVAPTVLEPVEQAAVTQAREPLAGQRRTRDVAAQPLESPAVAGGHAHVGVQAQARDLGAARAADALDVVGVDAVAQTHDALARARSRGNAVVHRGGGLRKLVRHARAQCERGARGQRIRGARSAQEMGLP